MGASVELSRAVTVSGEEWAVIGKRSRTETQKAQRWNAGPSEEVMPYGTTVA